MSIGSIITVLIVSKKIRRHKFCFVRKIDWQRNNRVNKGVQNYFKYHFLTRFKQQHFQPQPHSPLPPVQLQHNTYSSPPKTFPVQIHYALK